MDSANGVLSVEEIARLVVERLTADGKLSDLANANLLTLENEAIVQLDEVARAVISELLAKQSTQVEPQECCPKCGDAMVAKKPQNRLLKSRRGKVHFQTSVFHGKACRLDFFPSDENSSV